MKLATFKQGSEYHLGIHMEHGLLDVGAAAAAAGVHAPLSVREAAEGGEQAVDMLRRLQAEYGGNPQFVIGEEQAALAPVIPDPGKIICIGLNYLKHAEETHSPIPKYPILFNKFNNALAAHGEDVALPRSSRKVDYEAELAIIIGRTAKYVSEDDALDYVFGYCASNDLSARDLQGRSVQWLAGKSCDGFAPVGPYVVTKDEVGDPNKLAISCTVNGEVRQQSNTSDMIFDCKQIISYISQCMTLSPGDIILTGTPEGVVLGYPKEQQVYLQPGDVVTVEIEKLGALTNRIVAESSER
ncbi:fumarylacetoacetate hydrolase family protein [Paenibacillus protaetiae]|uniref:FAA hydrolase family protein n=1 Tax=Paenibacillus protaetiae TaxID=2509456 RepID=A0A4P6EVV3_9BACL|nr:fumarylacetoacetate hydrolase family protein [Paenibacillus protaetiae]QAY66796.1 FAA hydrolase family protein [Paenibacillus protaetiae]